MRGAAFGLLSSFDRCKTAGSRGLGAESGAIGFMCLISLLSVDRGP